MADHEDGFSLTPGEARVEANSMRRRLLSGLLWACCGIACASVLIGVWVISHPSFVHDMTKRWRESEGRFECQLVIDPGLAPGGLIEKDDRAVRMYTELSKSMGGLEAGLGEINERTGPANGQIIVSVWDYSAGSRHDVVIWLGSTPNGPTTADARVTWLEESGTESGDLERLHGVISISDVDCLNRSPTGRQQCVIKYELTGQKHYRGVVSEVTAANRITLWI